MIPQSTLPNITGPQQVPYRRFINRTHYSESEAKRIIEQLRRYVLEGEQSAVDRLTKAEKGRNLVTGKIWNDNDRSFFEALDITEYTINIQRPIFNTLKEEQEAMKLTFRVAPKDLNSYHRYVEGREKYAEEHAEQHGSYQQALEYYDENVDDEYAIMLSALMADTRDTCQGRYEEADAFSGGVDTGTHFLKADWSTKFDRSGGIAIQAVPQNAMIWDEARSTRYNLDDILYIGEVMELYPDELARLIPDAAEEIIAEYDWMVRNRGVTNRMDNQDWKSWYRYEPSQRNTSMKIKVAQLWIRTNEDRIRVTDTQTNESHTAAYGTTPEQIFDNLITRQAEEVFEQAIANPETTTNDLQYMGTEEFKQELADSVFDRYIIEEYPDEIWYKTLFTFNGLFEYGRSPYPHGKHPFAAYFAQFSEGYVTGVGEDIYDIFIAYQKAFMFRELMMAHGAKNLLLVDQNTLDDNNLKKEDIAEQWTQIGQVIALKLKPDTRMQDIAMTLNTVGNQGDYIDRIIAQYALLIKEVAGVTPEQMGYSPGETAKGKYDEQLRQARGNNGIIYKNWLRTLKYLYTKVMSLEIELLKARKSRVIRLLGTEYENWSTSKFAKVEWNDEMELFEENIRMGFVGLTLVTDTDTAQLNASREAMLFEMAQVNPQAVPFEVAMKYSTHPKRHQIVRDIQQAKERAFRQELANQIQIDQLYEIMLSMGVDIEVAKSVQTKAQLAAEEKLRSSQNPMAGQRTSEISRVAGDMGRQQAISETNRAS